MERELKGADSVFLSYPDIRFVNRSRKIKKPPRFGAAFEV
jgi:hypothetical protein